MSFLFLKKAIRCLSPLRFQLQRLKALRLVEMPSPMAYRLNGLPPFQVSFSITFPEGYYGKEKLDTNFQVEAEDSQVQVGPFRDRESSDVRAMSRL